MKKILIFGASGFLGSALSNSLTDKFEVIAVVRPNSDTWRIQNPSVRIVHEVTEKWANLVAEIKPQVVICAQWAGTELNLRDDLDIQKSNISHIEEIAIKSIDAKVTKFIAFGSQAETSKSVHFVPETELVNPASNYGAVKTELLRKLLNLFQMSSTDLIWARVFSVFGPMESGQTLLPSLLRSNNDGFPLKLMNPTLLWSFLYVDDFVAAIEILINTDAIGIFNIGNDHLETIENICKKIPRANVKSDHATPTSDGYFPEITKLRELSWSPSSNLEQAIRASVREIIIKLNLSNLM